MRPRARSHEHPTSAVQGVGGAGLFSDGKFSFWPSASSLWRLHTTLLVEAYEWFIEQLASVGIDSPRLTVKSYIQSNNQPMEEKRYQSVRASLASRLRLIERLAHSAGRIRPNCRVEHLDHAQGAWALRLTDGTVIKCKRLLLATGRMGPMLAAQVMPPESLQMLRLEAGVRIEQPAANFFLNSSPQLDPKYIWRDPSGHYEWRTFCCCRGGVVLATKIDGLTSVSGRADCAWSGRSNIGFNVRVLNRASALRQWEYLKIAACRTDGPQRQRLYDFIQDIDSSRQGPLVTLLGPDLSARLTQGLRLLMRHFAGEDLTDAILVGPSLEGVVSYPIHNDTLATAVPGMWVAGDITGTFRGLTAALVSGYVAGRAITRDIRRMPRDA